MENKLIADLVRVCEVLKNYGIEYLIVGGTAVALHGYFRITMNIDGTPNDKHDLDIWYNPTYKNYFLLLNALAELGFDANGFKKEKSPNPKKSYFQFETDDFSFDFLPELLSLKKFGSAFRKKEIVNLNGIEIWYISYEDLLNEKQENGRSKDINDIEQLKIRNSNETGQN